MNTLGEEYGLPVIVSTHPRTQKKLKMKIFHFIQMLGSKATGIL